MKLLLLILLTATSAPAMDRWAALSMLETGNNDYVIGTHGEHSRFQILPSVWKATTSWPLKYSTDASKAKAVAEAVMLSRLNEFRHRYGREPNDQEFYLLWNGPGKISKPPKIMLERANRFSNLCKIKCTYTKTTKWPPRL